jgi:BirA family biotin operon repressor/biotin-[acetyl-CoA-carboxylase] ligase
MTDSGRPSAPGAGSPFPAGVPASTGSSGPQTVERFGHPVRHFPVAVSVDAMAMAWAHREDGPHGATVVVEHEIGPRGYHGVVWGAAPADSLLCAVVLRPRLSAEEGDASWLVASLAALDGAEAASGQTLAAWWPATIVKGPEREMIASLKTDVQLGPGRVKDVVVTFRFDLRALGVGGEGRDELLEAVLGALDRVSEELEDGTEGVAARYEKRCAVIGQRVKVRLRPKGETRGTARSIDRAARLEIASPTGMVERVGIDQLLELSVV